MLADAAIDFETANGQQPTASAGLQEKFCKHIKYLII